LSNRKTQEGGLCESQKQKYQMQKKKEGWTEKKIKKKTVTKGACFGVKGGGEDSSQAV